MCLETFNVWWFQVSENCSSQQNYKKKLTTKNKKIPHNVWKKLFSQMNSQNFCKIELNSEKLELLRHSL